jgi:hypothetical protein
MWMSATRQPEIVNASTQILTLSDVPGFTAHRVS